MAPKNHSALCVGTEKCIDLYLERKQMSIVGARNTKVCAPWDVCEQISITSCSFQAKGKKRYSPSLSRRRMRSRTHTTHTRKHKELIYIAQHSTGNCSAERRLMNYLLSRAHRKCRIVFLAWVSARGAAYACDRAPIILKNASSAWNQSCVGEIAPEVRRQEKVIEI